MATDINKERKVKMVPRKYLHSSAHSLSAYNKKITLNVLTSNGCNTKSYENIKSRLRKSNPGAIEDYTDTMTANSQKNVPEECSLPLFESLNAWAEYFKERHIPEDCNYEPSLVLRCIAHLEKHPSGNKAGCVNFFQLYSFLANISRGDPSVSLDKPTADFLKETLEELQTAVGSCDGILDKTKLKSAVVENANILMIVEGQDEFPQALDPLNIEV